MHQDGRFGSQILETSAAGYAGLAASLLVERHPEYQELAARMASLFEEITELAVANEEQAGK